MAQFIDEQRIKVGDVAFLQGRKQLFSDFIIGARNEFTRIAIDHIPGQNTAKNKFTVNSQFLDAGGFQIPNMFGGDALVLGDDYLAVFGNNIKAGRFTFQTLGLECKLNALFTHVERFCFEEHLENLFYVVAQCLQQNRCWHLATTIDAEVNVVLGIEFEVKPGTTIRNDASREQQLA